MSKKQGLAMVAKNQAASTTAWGKAKQKEVDDLRRHLAEKTAECERLKTLREEAFQNAGTWAAEKGEAQRALAESQAREAKLRDLLSEFMRLHGGDFDCMGDGDETATATATALALKADDAALLEVCERVIEEAARFVEKGTGQMIEGSGVQLFGRECSAGVRREAKAFIARVLGGAK